MNIQQAVNLLDRGKISSGTAGKWADLGCGTGLFTAALARILPAGSIIYAADTDSNALRHIPESRHVRIIPQQMDFVHGPWPFDHLKGVLMANSLHYVQDKHRFFSGIAHYLDEGHRLLIVEYDRETSNRWVPFPISFSGLTALFRALGYRHVLKLGEYPSAYSGKMYSALIHQ